MIDRPFLLQDRIPVIAELILLFLSGGNKAKIISMINDNRAKWILATAQTIEGINLLTQGVKNNAIISQKEALQILFGNIRTLYVRDLFDILIKQKDDFPDNITVLLKISNNERQGKTYPIGIANHIDNICRSLQTIEKSAKSGHVKD